MRFGEMARLRDGPAHALLRHGGRHAAVRDGSLPRRCAGPDDDALYHELLPNVRRALDWIDQYGDLDGDGFVEYAASTRPGRHSQPGLERQQRLATHARRHLAETPIAACEVQGYVYAAKQGLSELVRAQRRAGLGRPLAAEAAELEAALQRRLLDAGGAVSCPGAGRATSGRSRRSPATPGTACGPASWTTEKAAAVARAADGARHALRLGDPHDQQRQPVLQPDELSQRQRSGRTIIR